jgi:hypothetical protein
VASETRIGCSYVKSGGRGAFGKESVAFLENPLRRCRDEGMQEIVVVTMLTDVVVR